MKLRSKIDHNSIKFKTWLYFILFAGFLMILLWVLQVLFLNNFYDVMKDEQTQRVAKTIQLDYQQKSSTKFLKSVESISNSNDMFIYVVSYDGKTMYFKPSGDATSAQYYSDQIKTVNEAMLKNNNESAYLRIKNPDDSKDVLA